MKSLSTPHVLIRYTFEHMLDIRFIRENTEVIRKAILNKQLPKALERLDALLLADEEFRSLRKDLEELQAVRNQRSKEIGERKRSGESAESLIEDMGRVSSDVKRLEEKSRSLEEAIQGHLLEIPNVPHSSVPYGEGEQDNTVVKEWGKKSEFPFKAKPHWELAVQRGWIDFEAGVKLTGAGFPVFKGDGALLIRALKTFFLDSLVSAGYVEIRPPILVNEESATATGQLPDKEGQMYQNTDGYYLIPTSEVSVTNLHRGEILSQTDLPVRYAAFTPNFRREAGSYGKEVRGLNRLHQFDKVEMVQFVKPEDSYEALEEMVAFAESLLEALELPYRRLLMCSGDMGFTQAKKYDLEVWSGGQNRWLEVSSVSNMEAFQASRLQTRYRPDSTGSKVRPELVHTLNGSALAFPRTIAAILEKFQETDGRVEIPKVLRPIMNKSFMD